MNFDDVLNLKHEMNELVRTQMIAKMKFCEGGDEAHGLDRRAVPEGFWYSDELIAVQGESLKRALEYYGGFEYIDADHRETLGSYTLYSAECPRVQRILDNLNGATDDE